MNGRVASAVLACALIAGCSGPADKARQRYEFLKANGGTPGEVCDAGREMLRALSEAGDKRFANDRVSVDIDCRTADQLGRGMPANQDDPAYSIEPDNMDAISETAPAATPRAATSSAPADDEPAIDEHGVDANGLAD